MKKENNIIGPIPFHYRDININETYWIDNEPYFTRNAIGEWLGYQNPQEAIRKIIERNDYIERPEWTETVNITGVDTNKSIKVYNITALILIIFESNKQNAITHKIDAALLSEALKKGFLKPETPVYLSSCTIRKIAIEEFKIINQTPYGQKTKAMKDISKKLGIPVGTLHSWFTQYNHMGTLDDKRGSFESRIKRVEKKYIEKWREIKSLLDSGHSCKDISEKLNVSPSQVTRVKNKYQPYLDHLKSK